MQISDLEKLKKSQLIEMVIKDSERQNNMRSEIEHLREVVRQQNITVFSTEKRDNAIELLVKQNEKIASAMQEIVNTTKAKKK